MRVSEPYTIFPRKLKSGKIVYYYQYRDENGLRSTAKSTGCTSLAQAKRLCQKMYNNNEFSSDSSMLFGKYADGFFDTTSRYYRWKLANQESITESTRVSYVRLLKHQVMPYFEKIPLNKITIQTIKDWIIWVTENWSAKTSNNAQSVLNIILTSACEEGLINRVSSAGLKMRKIERIDRKLLTVDELKMIFNHERWYTNIDRLAFLLAMITGMRIGEVVGIHRDSIHDNFIDVKVNYHGQFGEGQTKTKYKRFVPIPDEFATILKCISGDTWVFERNYKPVPAHTIYMNFCDICDDLQIDRKERKLTIHTLRNFYTSYLEGESVPHQKVKAVIGHKDKDKDMTEWYTYWTPDMVKEVYQAQLKLYIAITKE